MREPPRIGWCPCTLRPISFLPLSLLVFQASQQWNHTLTTPSMVLRTTPNTWTGVMVVVSTTRSCLTHEYIMGVKDMEMWADQHADSFSGRWTLNQIGIKECTLNMYAHQVFHSYGPQSTSLWQHLGGNLFKALSKALASQTRHCHNLAWEPYTKPCTPSQKTLRCSPCAPTARQWI